MPTAVEITKIGNQLNDPSKSLAERFRLLFTLRNLGGPEAITAISNCFSDPSALLKHELAYCLGQMKDTSAIPVLVKILEDTKQEPMVRHEAGEALGAIGDPQVLKILEKFSKDPCVEVSETCELALQKIKWSMDGDNVNKKFKGEEHFNSVDPTPPSDITDIDILKENLCNESLPLFDRYRAMFSLRNMNTPESAKALAAGFKGSSALFRHEIGFVLGQMACESVIEDLANVVRDQKENEMVRHEAAEALGSIASEKAEAVLKEFLNDKTRVVKESCEVALNISEYNKSSDFQYANGLEKIN